MSIYKRGDVYWYKFMWKGQVIRESTKQGNDKVARQMEATHRTSLAKGRSRHPGEEARTDPERVLRAQIRALGPGYV